MKMTTMAFMEIINYGNNKYKLLCLHTLTAVNPRKE